MANTFTLIASASVTSGTTGSLTFSSIPNTYTHLCLYVSARDNDVGQLSGLTMTINGTGWGTNYEFYAYNSTAARGSTAGETAGNGNGAAANTFGNARIWLPNYNNSAPVPFQSFGGAVNSASTQGYVVLHAGANPPSAAVTSVTIGASDLVAGSTAYLYGLKSS
jgi:hypothetical protein